MLCNNGLTSDQHADSETGHDPAKTEAVKPEPSEEMQRRLATIMMVPPSARYDTLNT